MSDEHHHRGAQGEPGVPGRQGESGTTGRQGEQGAMGLTGRGERGDAGKAGETGPEGRTGPAGDVGATGMRGRSGTDPVHIAMTWFWRVVLAGAAVFAAVLITITIQRDQLVEGCERLSQHRALTAYQSGVLSSRVAVRDQKGDAESSRQYAAISLGIIETMPSHRRPHIAETHMVTREDGRLVARVTDRAMRIQREACEDAYPTIIPFIE